MPAVPARKQAQPQKEQPLEIQLRVDGKLYVFRVADASAEDASALRRATGQSLNGLLKAAADDPDLDVVSGLVWLIRRRDEPRLRYETVAREIGYDTDIDFVDPDEAKSSNIRAVDDPDEDGGLDPTPRVS